MLTAQTSLATYKTSIDTLQADSQAKIAALEAERNREVSRTRDMERLLGRIEGESNEKDGPVAPVLRDTIDRLYGRSSDTSPGH